MTAPMVLVLAGVLGAAATSGLLCLCAGVLPPPPTDFAAAWQRIATRDNPATPSAGPGLLGTVVAQLASWSARREDTVIGLPTADLDLLGIAAASCLARRLRWGAACLAATGGLAVLADSAELSLPVGVAALAALAAGVAGSLVPAWSVRTQARSAREEFRRVLAVYLDLVAQERAAGRAPTQALQDAATVSEHPVFRQLRHTLLHAVRLGDSPWQALRRLADRIQVQELADLADIAATAATGAAIYTTLITQAASLRDKARSDDQAEANAATERLTLPVSLLLVGFLALVLYPTITRLFT